MAVEITDRDVFDLRPVRFERRRLEGDFGTRRRRPDRGRAKQQKGDEGKTLRRANISRETLIASRN